MKQEKKGLSWFTAAVFMVGSMAGAGVLSLPKATSDTGSLPMGIAFIVLCCIFAGSSCAILANSWLIVEEQWPECKEDVRDPFPTIAAKAFGPKMKEFVAITMDIQLFGTASIFLIISADLTGMITNGALSSCQLIVITAVILCPLSWSKSPKHFKSVGVLATICTLLSCILVSIVILFPSSRPQEKPVYAQRTWSSLSQAFSTVVFAFGGICTLPTIQNDMDNKKRFKHSIILGSAIMLLLYLPVASGGYLVFGQSVKENILENINSGLVVLLVNILIDFHVICAFLIVINPLNADLEQRFGVQQSFGIGRIVLRTLVLAFVGFVSLSIPKFGKILNLSGATILPLQTFILPAAFYYQLCQRSKPQRQVSKLLLLYFALVMIVGLIGMCSATFVAVRDLVNSSTFVPPCYLNPCLS